jgi:two-component system cell cycle sensor histidine kinase/response regulator CckA
LIQFISMDKNIIDPSKMSPSPLPSRSASDHMQLRVIIVFLILSFLIGLSGYFYYDAQKAELIRHIQNELSAIADLKVNQITAWRNERLADARIMERNPVLATMVRQFLQEPVADSRGRDILVWMKALLEIGQYNSIVLVDRKGRARLSTSPDMKASSAYAKQMVQNARIRGESILSDFHRSSVYPHPHLGLVAPLSVQEGKESIFIGAFLFQIDPATFLYPLIQSWPVASKSAETLLIRKEGDSVLFLNELRHKKNTALSFRIKLDKTRAQNIKAIEQARGMFEGPDYRKIPVLGSTRHIPQTPWILVAKVDVDEVYAPLRRQARLLLFIVCLLIASAGLVLLLWLRKRTAEEREKFSAFELESKALSQKYDFLSKYSNDIIMIVDEAGNIRDANDRALQAYGYTRDEFLRLTLWDIRPRDTYPDITTQMEQVREHQGMIFETVHKRKNGAEFPVEVSSRVIDEGNNIFFQSIIRDITERKQAEIALINERNMSQAIIAAIGDGISIQDRDFRITYQNQVMRALRGDRVGEYCYQAYEHQDKTCEGCPVY